MKDAKIEVISRLLSLARLIRRRGTLDESDAAIPYERTLEADLHARQAELAQLPGIEEPQQHAHAA